VPQALSRVAPRAAAQTTNPDITPVSGFHPGDPFDDANSGSVRATVPLRNIPNVHASVAANCIQSAGQLSFDVYLQGASFDSDKATDVRTSFGAVYSTHRDVIAYRAKLDDKKVEGTYDATQDNDSGDHHYSAPGWPTQLSHSSHLLLGATSAGRNVYLDINLKEPGLLKAIQACVPYEITQIKKELAAEAEKKATAERKQQEQKAEVNAADQRQQWLAQVGAFLGQGPPEQENLDIYKSKLYVIITKDVVAYDYDLKGGNLHLRDRGFADGVPRGMEAIYDNEIKAVGNVRKGTLCSMRINSFAKVLNGKNYAQVESCRIYGPGARVPVSGFVPVEAIQYRDGGDYRE
jgi:hypothetical protein